MTPPDSNSRALPPAPLETDAADLLISRVVDGVATPDDWRTFDVSAGRDMNAWRGLAIGLGEAQSQHAALNRAVDFHVAAAACELPDHDSALASVPFSSAGRVWSFARGGLGWVAAAALALAVYSGRFGDKPDISSRGSTTTAGLGSPITDLFGSAEPKELLENYLDRGMRTGEVLGELPDKPVLQAQPVKLDDGRDGYEVVYVRQIVERAKLSRRYQDSIMTHDELGRELSVPVSRRVPVIRKGSM